MQKHLVQGLGCILSAPHWGIPLILTVLLKYGLANCTVGEDAPEGNH